MAVSNQQRTARLNTVKANLNTSDPSRVIECALACRAQRSTWNSSTGNPDLDHFVSLISGSGANPLPGDPWAEGKDDWAWGRSIRFNKPLPTLALPSEDGYALTHAIFWATDFGRAPIDHAVARNRLTLAIPGALINPDLLGEYLLAMRAVGGTLLASALSTFETAFLAVGAAWHLLVIGLMVYPK